MPNGKRYNNRKMSMADKTLNTEEITNLIKLSLYDFFDEKYEREYLWKKVVKHRCMSIMTVIKVLYRYT